jgi:hypothetical protein
VGQLVAHGALDLRPEQLGIVAEVALQRVPVNDDAIRVGVASDGAADVVAIGVVLATATGDDHRRAFEQCAEIVRQVVQGLHHQLVEFARRLVRRRERGERLTAVNEPPELGLGHLVVPDCRHDCPGGDEHECDGTKRQHEQIAYPRE